jgi:hypothetical protein
VSAKEKRRRRWPWVVGLVLGFVVFGGTLALRVFANGTRLAELVTSQLNARIQGRVTVESIEWPLGDLPAILSGGELHLTLTGVKVESALDPATKRREDVITAPEITATLDVGAAAFGRHDLLLDHIVIKRGFALVKQTRVGNPKSERDAVGTSLTDAFRPPHRPVFHAGTIARPSAIIELKNYDVSNIHMKFVYPAFTAEVMDAKATGGSLTFDGRDPLAGRLFYQLRPTATTGTVTLPIGDETKTIEITDLKVRKLRQLPFGWPDETIARAFEYAATITTREGAILTVDGKMLQSLTDSFGGDNELAVTIEKAGGLAKRFVRQLGGDDLKITYHLAGSSSALVHHLTVAGLTATLPLSAERPPLEVTLARASASWDAGKGAGSIEDALATAADGEVRLSASVASRPRANADLFVEVKPAIELRPYLDKRAIAALGGSRLSGGLHASIGAETQKVDKLSLRLGDSRIKGGVRRGEDGLLRPEGLELVLGGTKIHRVSGTIDAATGDLSLDLSLDSSDVAHWLRVFRAPAVARTLRGDLHVGGNLADPSVRATLAAGGVPVVSKLDAEVRYQAGAIDIDSLEAALLGGWLKSSGRVVLGPRPRLDGVSAKAGGIDLAALPGTAGLVAGTFELSADAEGTLAAPHGQAIATVRGLELAGEAYDDAEIRLTAGARQPLALTTKLARKAGGGLEIDASYAPRGGALAGTVALRALPLDGLTALLGRKEVGGVVDGALTLSGTSRAPTVDGTLEVTRGWFRQAFLGHVKLTAERVADGVVRIDASLLQDRVSIAGTIGTRAPFDAELVVRLKRLELDVFAPELAARHGVRGWVSGELSYRGDLLAIGRGGKLDARARLDEVVVAIDGAETGNGPAQIRIANKTPIELTYDGDALRLVHEVVLRGPTGEFAVSGSASEAALALKARGKISVALLAPYVRQYFDRVSGELAVELNLTGTRAKPKLAGVVEVHAIAMQPTGQDTLVRVPSGRIEVDGEQLSLTGLSMVVTDEFSKEQSELRIAGGVRLNGFRPALWAINIDGQLDGKMLLVFAPQVFSSGFGSADLSIALQGAGLQPDINGSVEFSADTPLTIVPRGVRREIALTGGSVSFSDQLIAIGGDSGPLTGTIDDEGFIERLEGEIGLERWRPVDVDVEIDASGLPVRIPGTLELTVNLRRVRFVGGADGLDVGGVIEVPDGRYLRKFNVFTDVLKPERASTPSVPFWESSPMLARARLDLTVISQAFYVKNNLANIAMSGQVTIGGTPRRPRFEGVIRVDDGDFKLQLIRPRFERAGGTVSFEPLRQFPDATPRLDLHAEADYTDSSGQAHLIHLAIKGTLSNVDWDLRTESGLNKAQTLQLVLVGRTPDELRAALGDNAIGKPGTIKDDAGQGGGFVYADQFVKDLSGDFFSLLIGDSLKSVTQLDVVRLTLGTSAIGAHGEKHITPSLHVNGDLESSLRGWYWDLTSEYRLTDAWSLEGSVRHRYYDDQAIEDQKKTSLQTTWRWVLLP